ncbi:ComEC/Rec2 family competence protein [Aeromonas media]|uniref:hypothetical protein n=1 Tax=Aeromonas media TaxID=651 RepID=UPI00223F7568|nr:hypothetical protein [Aeromonas media]HCT5133847.1 hypothetical protein [Aeromonas hydrophila]
MPTVTFYPVGNGDTSLIKLDNKKMILMDYHQKDKAQDTDTPECDIAKALRKELDDAKKNSFEVVAFTHADADHIKGSSEFFYLEHAKAYQDEGRIIIDELWVPAAMLIEVADQDKQKDENIIWRREARHRLKNKKGIKVFSKPEGLIDLIETQWERKVEEFDDFIIDAGTLVDTFTLSKDGVEFFVHSPFVWRCEESGKEVKKVRNDASLVFNVRFDVSGQEFNYLAVGDSVAEVMESIYDISVKHDNEDRLKWDLFNVPHHGSYLALANEGDKGDHETIPLDKVKKLLKLGQKDAYMICSSQAFEKNIKDAESRIQPPHIQARKCYERYLDEVNGRRFIVTGEYEDSKKPKPIVIQFEKTGVSIKKVTQVAAVAAAVASQPLRAG